MKITASVVLYKTSEYLIDRLLAAISSSHIPATVLLIDNSPQPCLRAEKYPDVYYQFLGVNLGYGKAHNLALERAINDDADYHVILNPDINFPPETMGILASYMEANPGVGLVMPRICYPGGETQFLCKLLPTPGDLIGRRFLGKLLPRYVVARNSRLEMRVSGYNRELDVPWLSGCFMFLRASAAREVGGFDPRYFMYAKDLDLSRRLHARFRTVYLPKVSVVHDHAKESFRSWRMMLIHVRNVVRYFNKWGWWIDPDRTRVNQDAVRKMYQRVSATRGSEG